MSNNPFDVKNSKFFDVKNGDFDGPGFDNYGGGVSRIAAALMERGKNRGYDTFNEKEWLSDFKIDPMKPPVTILTDKINAAQIDGDIVPQILGPVPPHILARKKLEAEELAKVVMSGRQAGKAAGLNINAAWVDEMTEVPEERFDDILTHTADRINYLLTKKNHNLTFVLTDYLPMSVKNGTGWRKRTLNPHTSLDLDICRVGARDNLLFGFTATTDAGETFYCEAGLPTAETHISEFKDIMMMALDLIIPLGSELARQKANLNRSKENTEAKKEEKVVEIKPKNPLFGSW